MKPHVLVLHDDPIVARSWSASLRGRGFTVETVADSGSVFDHPEFDVLVTGREVGRRTGFDLVAALATERPTARAILVAAQPTEDDYRRALAVGVRAIVAEPVRLDELARSIELAVEPRAPLPQQASARTFRWSGDACPSGLKQAVREVLGFLLARGVGPTLRARIGTATLEVLENVWEHAYFEQPGPLAVEARVGRREIVVRIEDEGTGFDALAVTATAFNGEAESGLARVAALVEDLQVETEAGRGTSIALKFGAYGAGFDDSDRFDLSDYDYLPSELARRVHAGEIDASVTNVPPALAVVIGRLLSGPNQALDAMRSLWG